MSINHNKNDLSAFQGRMEHLYSNRIDFEVYKNKIIDNIDKWENEITRVPNLSVSVAGLKTLHDILPVRIAYLTEDIQNNINNGYRTAKGLVALGIKPSAIKIITLSEFYKVVRGFGEDWAEKKSIYTDDLELLIIQGVREHRTTDVEDNVVNAFKELMDFLSAYRNINCILIGESTSCINILDNKTFPTRGGIVKLALNKNNFRLIDKLQPSNPNNSTDKVKNTRKKSTATIKKRLRDKK